MRYLAKNTNIYCKMSLSPRSQDMSKFLNTTIKPWSSENIKPFVQHIMTEFDTEKLIWGSDWPVALLAASYEETFKRVTATIDRLSKTDRSAVLGGNAMTFYELS